MRLRDQSGGDFGLAHRPAFRPDLRLTRITAVLKLLVSEAATKCPAVALIVNSWGKNKNNPVIQTREPRNLLKNFVETAGKPTQGGIRFRLAGSFRRCADPRTFYETGQLRGAGMRNAGASQQAARRRTG
jgi:hypothetical protein